MKWLALAIWLAAAVALTGWLRRNPRHGPTIWMLFPVLAFLQPLVHGVISPVAWPTWPGEAKGIELTMLDVLAFCILFGGLRATNRPFPFRMSFGFFFFTVLFASSQSAIPVASLFYAWQLAKTFLVCVVVTRACETDDRVPEALLKGLGISLCIEAAYATVQHFVLGIGQAGGTVGHQNLLGMMTHFVSFPFFALLLSGADEWLVTLVPWAAMLAAIATGSRATILLELAGFMLVFLLSALRQWTSRKATIAAAGLVIMTVLTPVLFNRLQERGASVSEFLGDVGRTKFETAARMILADHPLGIGANMFTVTALQGYFQRADVAWANFSAMVHNAYLLVAVENGYLGLLAFVLMLLQPMTVAFRCGWRNWGDRRGDLLLGFGVSFLIVYIHSTVEFEFLLREPLYLFAIAVGIVGGLAQRLGYWQRESRRSAPAASRRLVGPADAVARSSGAE